MRRVLLGLAVALLAAGCGGGAKSGLPRGFKPFTAAAVGARDLWVLGSGTLLRSTDAGQHFVRAGLPSLPSEGNTPQLVFASARVGYAFAPGSRLHVTRNSGARWERTGPGAVREVVVAGGETYGWFGRNTVERSRTGSGSWRTLAVPSGYRWLLSLAARGPDVWLLATPNGPLGQVGDATLRSVDGGRTFARSKAPCLPGLGGELIPAGGNVVWAVCPSGMMAGLTLSTDGGRSFRSRRSFYDPGGVRLPSLTNGARIFPLSPRAAVLDGGGDGPLYRTTDDGKRWENVRQPGKIGQLLWLGFATPQLGYALVSSKLWRTTDGGASWSVVPTR